MRSLLQLLVASASLAISAETVIDIDFTKGTRPVNNAKVGVCRGVLPQNINDNFSSWSEGQCETKLMTEKLSLTFCGSTPRHTPTLALFTGRVPLVKSMSMTVSA